MSTLKADTIQNTSGGAVTLTKQSAAKGWLKYDHQGGAVDGSFNVSAVTDQSLGKFAQNHTNNMGDANYSPTATTGSFRVLITNQEGSSGGDSPDTTSTAYFEACYNTANATYSYIDMASNCTTIQGDLA